MAGETFTTTIDRIIRLEKEISTIQDKINAYGSITSDLNSRVIELEKGKVKNPIYEETLEQSIKNVTDEINKALKALHDELIKWY